LNSLKLNKKIFTTYNLSYLEIVNFFIYNFQGFFVFF